MKKGQICYFISGNDIKPVEFIEKYNSQQVYVKNIKNDQGHWVNPCYVYNTKEQVYKALLSWLEYDIDEAEYDLKQAQKDLEMAQEKLKNFKQKYEI